MKNNDLKIILDLCEKSSKNGYNLANKYQSSLNQTLKNSEKEIQNTINKFNNSKYDSSKENNILNEQLLDIKNSFRKLSTNIKSDLENKKDTLSKFSITLFGRTMAGKSTLMEILTNGDGKSIGLGSQRTTRDIRKYMWNNLEITDVPGIGAFEGQEDEDLAFESAKSADLILFLITDDAPQPKEAECFSKIINLGKPIISIINVKTSITENTSIKMAKYEINKKFDTNRLDSIKEQFLSYSLKIEEDWSNIPFIYVHLKSAFLSQKLKKQSKENSKILYEMSKINFLKKKIIKVVKNNGEFYRLKTFIDLVSKPIIDATDTLLDQSIVNSTQGKVVLNKKRELETWEQKFNENSTKEIKSFINNIKSQLNSEIASFAEDYFEDKNANKAWEIVLKNKKIEEKAQDLMKKFENQCTIEIKEITRELENELKFSKSFIKSKKIKTNSIINGKKIWNWSVTVMSSGFTIGSIIAFFLGSAASGPIGWVALGISAIGILGSFLFESREKKENRARKKLEKHLQENVLNICKNLEKQMNKNLNLLIQKRIFLLIEELYKVNTIVFNLADTQKKLAWNLNSHLLELNKQLITEAIKLIGAEGMEYHIYSVARIPGITSLIVLNNGVRIPKEEYKKLYLLINEKIIYTFFSENKKILISRVLGSSVNRSDINIEEKIGVAHIKLKNSNISNKIKMAQQLTKILIQNIE